jgi:ABC-type transport system involved in cytochrome c biogenesis permease subunit
MENKKEFKKDLILAGFLLLIGLTAYIKSMYPLFIGCLFFTSMVVGAAYYSLLTYSEKSTEYFERVRKRHLVLSIVCIAVGFFIVGVIGVLFSFLGGILLGLTLIKK